MNSIIDPSLEITDPTPNIYNLFREFNAWFFHSKLDCVAVEWSTNMKRSAGECSFHPSSRYCNIRLSEPLLKLRSRKDLVETLLHEMIHAYLFVTNNDRDRTGHGPEFRKWMHSINNRTGTNITVYHDFYDEVDHYRNKWYRCTGPCREKAPLFGYRLGTINRGPCRRDQWYTIHKSMCSGTFFKVLHGPNRASVKQAVEATEKKPRKKTSLPRKNINNTKSKIPSISNVNEEIPIHSSDTDKSSSSSNFVPFSGQGLILGIDKKISKPSIVPERPSSFPKVQPTIKTISDFKKTSEKPSSFPKVQPTIKTISDFKKTSDGPSSFPKVQPSISSISDSSGRSFSVSSAYKESERSISESNWGSSYQSIPSTTTESISNIEDIELEKAIKLSKEMENEEEGLIDNEMKLAIEMSLKESVCTKEEDEYVECPSCVIVLPISQINDHLNHCLS